MCFKVKNRERICVCLKERECVRALVTEKVYVIVRNRERICFKLSVCVRESERERRENRVRERERREERERERERE